MIANKVTFSWRYSGEINPPLPSFPQPSARETNTPYYEPSLLPWSNPGKDGELIREVVIDDFAMPWEAREGFKLAKGIPKWYEWVIRQDINQVGCIYTVQGFKYDYIGVIIGDDLVFDPASGALAANIRATCDPILKKY